jgi:hypothetical protein
MCNLRDDTPAQVIDTLKYMTRTEDYKFDNPPDYPFFKGNIWRNILRIPLEQQNMGKFTGDEATIFRRDIKYVRMDVTYYFWTLYIRQVMHGDVQFEYMCFAHWLAQYSERVGFVGYCHSQYAIDEGTAPNFLCFVNSKLQIVSGSTGQVFTDTEHCDDQESE